MTHLFAPKSFDYIAAVATLHHLPLRPALARFRNLPRSHGVLAVVGCYRAQALTDFAIDAVAVPANWILRSLYGYYEPTTRKQDARETLQEIRRACDTLLPAAQIKRLLFLRYLLLWRKP